MKLWFYNRNEGAGPWWKTAQWAYGRAAKGWWYLGRRHGNYLGIVFALGGEDNMVQCALTLPFAGHFAAGFRVPRKLTAGWIYQRREWGFKVGYIGHWLDAYVAFDDSASDMASYYRRKRENGESLEPWNRVSLWPGWHFAGSIRTRDWLLGRARCATTESKPEPVIVPMPEGNYPGVLKREERVWKRRRWPWPSKKRRDFWVDMEIGIPVPGKGENSWDCEDDAIFGTGGDTRSEAIGNVTKAALRQRERYGHDGWVPDAGWPEVVS